MRTRGFTLIELMVATVVMAILGTILARMLVQDSQFVSKLEAMMDARQSARGGMNALAVELQMVTAGGVTTATNQIIRVRAPYAWGLACQRAGGATIVSLVPADSMQYAAAIPAGLAYRNGGGYTFESPVGVAASGNSTACTNEGIQVFPDGNLVAVTMPDVAAPGTVVYLYQLVRYEFAASTELPGRTALWRQAQGGPNEELLAPFNTSSRFRFYITPTDTAMDAPPADLEDLTGIELQLLGESLSVPEGETVPQQFDLITRVTFLNRVN